MFTVEDITKIVNKSTITGPTDMYCLDDGNLLIAIGYDHNNHANYAYCVYKGERKEFVGRDARDINAVCVLRYMELQRELSQRTPKVR